MQWVFDRYVRGRLMAEGARITHAVSEADAKEKARALFAYDAKRGEMDDTVFVVRQSPELTAEL